MSSAREHVILIHGLGRSPRTMLGLQWWLIRAGFTVLNVAYPSRRISVAVAVNDYISSHIHLAASSFAHGRRSVRWTSHSGVPSCWHRQIGAAKSWIIWRDNFGFVCCSDP
jgi:hypothetical protein